MRPVFLSYASSDRPRVRPLVDVLQQLGFEVFWDRRIPPGRHPMEFLAEKLAECCCVVVVWSAASVGSRYVRDEAGHGYDRDHLIPVRLDDTTPPFPFTNVQAADLSDWDGSSPTGALDDLITEVRSAAARA